MLDPVLTTILWKTFTYALCGTVVAAAMRFADRKQPGPRLDQAAAVGFLVGAAFGAFFAIFQSMLGRL